MSNDLLKGISLDLSYTNSLASSAQAEMEARNQEMLKIGQEAYDNRKRMQKAIEQTAENTSQTNERLQKIIDNQNEHIDLLKDQLNMLKGQLQTSEEQLNVIKAIFANDQDSMVIEQEIAELIKEQMNSNHPIREYLLDKGGDVAVAGVTAGIPFFYNILKTYLASKGIILP